VGEQQQQRVSDQDDQEARHEHERQAQRRQHRRQHRIEDREKRADYERRPRLLECDARQDCRGHPD
jgi:hypothetical protein